MSESLLAVRRPLSSPYQVAFSNRIPEVNHQMPDYVSLKWRRFGLAALTLLERGEYLRALNKTNSGLKGLRTEEISEIVEYGLSTQETTKKQISANVNNIHYVGKGDYVHIAMAIESPELEIEREKLLTLLDELSGVNSGWRQFDPHISLASIEAQYAEDEILKPFKKIMPSIITLNPVVVRSV